MEENFLCNRAYLDMPYLNMIERILNMEKVYKSLGETIRETLGSKVPIDYKLIEELYKKYNKLISKEEIEATGEISIWRKEQMIDMLDKDYKRIKYSKGTCKLIKIGKQK